MDEGADKQEQEGLIATPTAPTAPTHPVPTAEDNPAPPATSPTSPDDDDQYEREDVQKKTFAKWINSQLAKGQHPPVTDLFYDLRDGTRLLALLEVLTNKTYKREKGRMRVHHLNNVSRALSILEEHNVKLINISNEHIVDGSAKLTLGLVWAIILHWQVQGVLKDVMSDLQQTNLEKTLLAWCRQTTKGYHGVDVRNFTTSWTDGLAFNALIHSHRPQLFDWTVMARKHPYARLENAFRLANEHFNIERLLDPEDVNSQVPDKKSIMMYVMCLFQALPHGSFTMESLDVSIQSDSSFSLDTSSENVAQATSKGRPLSNVSIGLGEYQRTLEEVLTWLLGAEDRLAVMPPIANSTEEVKDQFHDLEELMLELTSKQGGIGDVLGEGSRLLKEGVMEEEEEEEVRVQMKLLNTRWEDLRVKAMDRQSRLHEKLMTLQQTQLESLKKWLTETEDRIANMSQVGPTTDLLREQIAAHQSLQEDLESEQANINSLSNMVVVVDESSSDSAYSSLEDELNALGERWAHICRWAESRWKTLQTLSVHWTHYEQEMNKMGEWMNEKESLLREVESNPSSDQEHILRQASMLQILQAEMEVQHRRFEHLQEESAKVLSHLPQDSPGQEKIPSELEMVQDRLDCLVSIIEAQTQRMAANGIDIKKVVIPADNTSDIVSSSTTTISHEDATVVTKIITTKIVTTETVEGSVIKRQKLEGGSQEDFSVALHQLGGWMDSLEAEVRPKVAGELTVEQLMQLAQQLENEIESQKEEYYKVVSLGQSAISETSTIGESAKESEQQVAGITSRWEALNAMLIEIRTRITFLTQKKKVTTQLSDLEVQYEGFLRWCDDVRTVSENEPNAVSLQIEQCQSKIAAMESHESEISALKVACEALDSNFAQETQPVMEQVQIFITKWEALKIRLVEWNVTLKERLGQVSPSPMVVETVQTAPPESLVKAMEASRKWLESLETALATEHVVSSLPQMQDMLLKFQDLSQKVEMEQGNMKHINDACSALIKEGQIGISEDFTKLNKQWETTTEALQSRIKAIEKVIEKQKQYNDEVSGLCSWMSEVDVFLQAEEPALGDIETLEAQLEQSNALQDDIVTLENNVANITTSGKQLMDEAEPELKGAISVQLDELTKRWALVTELAKAQNKSLKDALAKSQKVHEDIQALNTWLDEMDQKVPSFGPVETSSELSAAIDLFSKLREEISEHSEEFRGVNNTGNEMLQHDAAATHEELARQFTQLNGRWTDVVTQVDSRHRVLSTASEQYDDFKKLCGEETEWLNQLQEKLEKSSKSAADAEEISEALDDLEIFLHSHNESRLEQIRNLAEALVQENCMSVAVQNATHTLTSRFDTLNAQASEHQSGLEGRVQEAQAWEREYVSVLDYLVQSDMVLTQAITDSQLRIDPVQVQAELVKQQEVLKKMQTQVDVYRTQGKTEAALRLEDQVTHLLKKYEEVEMKLRLCQKPSDFDDRLQQMNQELKDISQRVHLVTVTSGDPEGIQEQLNQCMALYQRLSEVKAEVESVIATGRKIVKEGQALDPETLTLQLDQLKGLYNQLGGTVTEHRGVLERALRHSRKIHKDSSHLEEWLSTTECELDQREATIPTRNVEGEVHFAQSEQVNKEAEMEKFIVGLGEIKGWLQSTEYQLTNLSAMDADEQARIIKSISTEVQNYKGHIENIRDTAVDLINHGALFQARVQPELIEINQRWENIFKNVQVNPACEVDNSSLGSVTMSTGQHSVPSTIRSFAPSEGVSDQFPVLSQKNVSGDGGAQKNDMTPITLTHVSSGISSSMMDFFSRHNVLIVDTDAKGQDGTVTVEPMEEDEGKIEEAKCLNVNVSEAPVRSPSPIQTLGSEIMQDLGNIRETVQNFSSSVTSTSSATTVGAIPSFRSPAEMWSHFTRDMPSVMNIQSMHFQFPVAGDKSKLGRNVPIVLDDEQTSSEAMSEGNLESQPVLVPTPVDMSKTAESTDGLQIVKPIAPSEMQYPTINSKPQVIRDIPIMLVEDDPTDMDKTFEKTLDLPHERQGITVSSDTVTGGDGVSKDISDTSEVESNVKEDITNPTQNITENLKEDVETAAPLMLSDSSHSGTLEIQTQMIEASDVESGSLIEVIYQVEGSKGRRKAVVTPPDEAGMAELLQEASQCDILSKDSQNISSEGASSRKISVASQSMILAEQEVVENIAFQTISPEACVSFQNLPTNIADDMVTPLSTEIIYTEGAVPQDVERKVSVGSMEISVSLDEVAGDIKIPDQPAQSFAHERKTSLAEHEQFSECVVTKSDDILLMDVECLDGRYTGRKMSTISMEVNIESGEIAGTHVTGSFAAERQTSLTSDNMKDFVAVRSEVVQMAGPLLSSEELIIPDIQSGLMTDSNRASPREESLEKLPIGFIDAEMTESQIGLPRSSDSFSSEDQLYNPLAQNVGQEASENLPSARESIETERKISTATEEFTFAEQEVVSAISTPLIETQSFTYPQDISLTVKENLAEGAVLSSVIQMKNSCQEEDKQEVERKLSTATKAVEVIPYEIPEAVGTAGVETRAFALERSASETGREILKEAVLVSPETILQGTPQECESHDAAVNSSASYLVATDFDQRKISVASDLEVLEVIERTDQFEPLIEQSLTEETIMASTEGHELVDMKVQTYKAANESGRKISTASMEIEESYSEALCEKQMYLPERYACTVEVPELYSCEDDVITTSVKAVVADGSSKMDDPGTKDESSRHSVAISELSEEGIPLGCEAALINPNLVTGFEIKSLSGEGTDFEDISVDEIAFITGVKSAMPAGYTFRTNTAEDDTMSEALSYYDLDNSFAVKDRYGVAVTVSGTLEGTEALVDEGGEEKQIPLEEGGIEELVMEPSFNALLKSSRHSSRGASLDNLFNSGVHEEGAGIEKICNEEPEVASANRSTFLTEVETSSHKHFADVSKVEKYQYQSVTSINSSQDTTPKTNIEITSDIRDKKKSSETVVSDSAVPGENLSPGEEEMPFVSTKEVRKPDIKLDRLNSLSDSVPIKKDKSKEVKAIKKVKITVDDSPKTESKLQYTPFNPPGIKYGHTVKDMDDDVSKTDIAQKVMEKEIIVKECYTPHQPPERSERSDDKSISLVNVPVCPEGLKVRDQVTEDKSTTEPTVLSDFSDKKAKVTSVVTTEHDINVIEQTNIQTLSISISNGEDHKTITHTSEVSSDRSTVSEKEKDSIPAASESKDSKTMKVSVPEAVHLALVKEISKTEGDKLKPNETESQKKTDVMIQYVPHVPLEIENKTEVEKPAVTYSKPKIHYVPHVPSDLLKESCEAKETSAGKSPIVTETKIATTKPVEVKVKKDVKLHYVPYAPSDILKSIPEEEKNSKEVSVKTSKIESLPHQTNLQQQKNVEKIEKEFKTDAQKKIQYVPHVPIKAEAAIPVPTSLSIEAQEKKTTKSIIIREEELNTVKETAITSDDEEVGKVELPNAPKAKTEKTEPIKINYVPCVTGDTQVLAADRKTKSVIEAQVHVPAEKPKNSATVSSRETIKDKEKSEIQYVPYASNDTPKVSSGARPKEIYYVPHAPSDLERFKIQEPISKAPVIPSVIITSPSSCKLDSVVTSSSSIPEIIKHEAGGTPKPAAVSFTKDTSRQQTQTSSSTVTSVSKISHVYTTQSAVKGGKETHKAGDDEVDAYLREVTLLADKITELKKKAGTVPSYQEAKDKSEALEQEVALLEPDVATVISRGDTLTLTTHMVDVPRANTIRTAVHDLRTHWSSLKGETETVKLETGEVITKINNIQSKSDDIVGWMNDVSKRLHLVNNDESQLEALEKEMADKKSELDNLNESGKLLKKYGYEQIQPLLAIINTRWIELTTQFSQYRKVSLEKKTIVSSNAQQEVEPVVVPDFIASVNRLREAISAISRQLNANKLAGRRYDNLKLQEEELKTIKQGLETLKPRVDNLETERNNTIKNVTQTQSEQIRRVMDKLREEWAQVNRGYTERHALWLQCSETWRTLQKTIDDFSVWLSTIEERVQITANQPLPEAKITQKELEKQVTLKHRPSQTLQSTCKEVTEDMSLDDAKRLQERVDTLMKRWRALLLDLAARRERIAGEEGGKDSTSSEYEALLVWVDQAQALMDAPVNVTDEATLSAHSTMIQNHLVEMTTKQNLLKKLKDSKPKAVTPAQLSTLETNLNKVAKTLPEYKNLIETKLGVTKTLVTDVEDLYKWTEEMRVKVALRNMTDEEIKLSKITLREKETLYENLDSTYWVLAQDTESKGLTVSVALKNRMNTIESRLKALQGQLYESSASATPPSPTSPTFSRITPEKADQEKVVGEKDAKAASKEGEVLKKAAAVAVAASKTTPEVVTTTSTKTTTTKGKVEKTEALSVTSGTTVTSSVTSVIQNVIKFEESVFGAEGALRPPSPLVCPPKHAPDSSPVLILASLDKSILQIRDWLTLMEQMTRQQTVVVGDADDIRQLTEKQKNVLRELEGKKPQLDELVASADSLKDDASRTQLHQKAAEGDAAVYKFPTHSRLFDHLRTCFKVSKLREHWDETNSVVLARKTQLDAMYADTHKFDAKRAELETWLARMEARLERMAPVAHTADVLDQQIREQKGFHAEIHQYKHQVELFNQMTQRLIAIYQHDDTRRLKKITETINLRYSSLNSSIIARGKALHSAMNSLHNFDKALDKFASWMSEAESSTDILELEVDKLGPGRRDLQARAPIAHLKDLQSEIESHKDVLASLNATGQKLLGTLENQDEAVMLQRRLEEMNQRWNTLKHKSIAIRNRLEGNAENWNSLLLSLRELIEWVIRKDTELTALGPLVGDLNALAKFSDDLAAFRRVIDEKQPVIESNLKSGRQLIASEPPLSDTSDSEAGRELDGDARYRGDDNARDLTRAVRREVAKLSEKWAALRERAAAANAQADLACKKLGVLQKTVEEVSGRLEEAQKTVDTWGAVPQDPNLADQHVHNVRKFREGLAELQRGVDDVNDQAARFSAHNVPLTPANSAKLHDLNNRWKTLETTVNDRWRQVAGRSREVTPLTPAQLASSVSPPWERATTSNKVPYYINHDQESTHWDHPTMMDLLDSLTEFNHIKFSAYRTATKLRMLQKTLALDRAKMQMATDVFDEHGLRGQNDRLIDVGDMVVVLSALYANISADHPEVNTTLAMDLCLNWLLNVYDSQRTGQMRVLSFKIGIVCLCRGHLEEKYRYMFRLIADPNRLVDQRKLGLLLHDCVQVPRQLGEVAAFGGSNIEPSVRSCFTKAGKDRETIEAVHFLTWVQQEPQSLVWLAVLHRVAASENIQHQVKCNICKAYPIVGLRYRCLKCLSFDMCQRCFFDGRSGKSHKITHPMHEYCTATTAGEDVKDFTKALKNKFKSKRALQKHTKKGYLPVQTVLEGDPLESPSPSPQHNVTSQDMHSRLELYASRLAEVELRTNSNSTPDRSLVSSLSEDEHGLIAQYCQSLSSSDAPLPVPRSPLQIMAAVDAEQKDELEQMIRALEEENSQLQAEYDRLKSQQPVGSPPDDGLSGQRSEADMLAEAKLLRQHKGRLEARMGILEEHNRQLEAQLHRLRQLLGEPGGMSSPNKSGTLQTKSVTASQLAMDSPAKVNGHSNQGGASSAYEGLDQMSEYVRPPPPPMGSVAHVGNLFSRAGDLGKAVGTLVATMTHEGASDLPSDEEERSEASDTEEEKAV